MATDYRDSRILNLRAALEKIGAIDANGNSDPDAMENALNNIYNTALCALANDDTAINFAPNAIITSNPATIDGRNRKQVYAYSPDNCPAKHYNDGTDFCVYCGHDLQAEG